MLAEDYQVTTAVCCIVIISQTCMLLSMTGRRAAIIKPLYVVLSAWLIYVLGFEYTYNLLPEAFSEPFIWIWLAAVAITASVFYVRWRQP